MATVSISIGAITEQQLIDIQKFEIIRVHSKNRRQIHNNHTNERRKNDYSMGGEIMRSLLSITVCCGALLTPGINTCAEPIDDATYLSRHQVAVEKRHHTWPDGRIYDGEWMGDQPHGQGMLSYADGGQYWGRFVNGKRQGEGLMKFVNGDEYEGHWFDDQPHGQGSLLYAAGGQYKGEFQQGQPAGKGRKTYADDTYYEGQWKQGIPHGFGRLTFADGGSYEGQFDQGKPHGRGIYYFVNGDLYEGDWYRGQQRGKGRYDYATGGSYEGEVVNGKRHGQGRLVTALGQRFEGRFVNNDPDGAGRCGSLADMVPCRYEAGKRVTTTPPPAIAKATARESRTPAPAVLLAAATTTTAAPATVTDIPPTAPAASPTPEPAPVTPQKTAIKSAIPDVTTDSKGTTFSKQITQAKQEWKKRSLADLSPVESDIDFNHQGSLAALRNFKGRVWFQKRSSLFQDNLEIISQHGATQVRMLIEDYKGPGQYPIRRVTIADREQRFAAAGDEPGMVRIVADNDGWISGEFSFQAASQTGGALAVKDGVFRISAAAEPPSFLR